MYPTYPVYRADITLCFQLAESNGANSYICTGAGNKLSLLYSYYVVLILYYLVYYVATNYVFFKSILVPDKGPFEPAIIIFFTGIIAVYFNGLQA